MESFILFVFRHWKTTLSLFVSAVILVLAIVLVLFMPTKKDTRPNRETATIQTPATTLGLQTPPEVKIPEGAVTINDVTITGVWTFTDEARKDVPSGAYEMRRGNGEIVMVDFCSPYPTFEQSDKFKYIIYLPSGHESAGCDKFVTALPQ